MTDKQAIAPPNISDRADPQSGMAQCSVTGKWFPEDEVVAFQGQLVSAEGKQILLDRLQTGAEKTTVMTRPSVWRRFWCLLIDWLILGPLWLLVVRFTIYPLIFLPPLITHPLVDVPVVLVFLVLGVAVIGYFSLQHGQSGKSIGKVIGKLRVVNLDGSRISRKKALARAVAYFGIILVMTARPLTEGLLPESATGRLNVLAELVFMLWTLADIALALADTPMQRSLHDRICGTRVIRENA